MSVQNDLSLRDDGGPAFPVPMGTQFNQYACGVGMSLRDWFAGQAMAGFHANREFIDWTHERTARAAFDAADAMLIARAKAKSELQT